MVPDICALEWYHSCDQHVIAITCHVCIERTAADVDFSALGF